MAQPSDRSEFGEDAFEAWRAIADVYRTELPAMRDYFTKGVDQHDQAFSLLHASAGLTAATRTMFLTAMDGASEPNAYIEVNNAGATGGFELRVMVAQSDLPHQQSHRYIHVNGSIEAASVRPLGMLVGNELLEKVSDTIHARLSLHEVFSPSRIMGRDVSIDLHPGECDRPLLANNDITVWGVDAEALRVSKFQQATIYDHLNPSGGKEEITHPEAVRAVTVLMGAIERWLTHPDGNTTVKLVRPEAR